MSLGAQTPLKELINASQAHHADIVALSFSAASNPGQVAEGLAELRQRLDQRIELWAGTPHAVLHRRGVMGVILLATLEQIPTEIQRWRSRRSTPADIL